MSGKILLAGESWQSTSTHVKGFDLFTGSEYETGHTFIKEALEENGFVVEHMPSHVAATDFPYTMEEINKFDAVILSDIGSNTLLLPPETFKFGKRMPNRCDLLRDYVIEGGALLMMGGYLTFTGINGSGRWGATSVQEVLPVELTPYDDRAEHPEGIRAQVAIASHPVVAGISGDWPFLLGYNKATPVTGAEIPVTFGGDPLIALIRRGKGRCGIFSSDCGPHWAPKEFTSWEHWPRLWGNFLNWLIDKQEVS